MEQLRLYPRVARPSRFYLNLSAGESILLSRCRYFAQKEQKKFQRAKLSLPKAILDIVHRQLDSVLGLCFASIDTLALGPIQLEKRYSCDQARRLVKRLQAKRLLVPCGFGPKRTICYVVFECPADQTTARLLRDLYEVELGQDRAPHLRLVPVDAEPLLDWSDRNAQISGQPIDCVAEPDDFCKGTPCRSARLSLIEDPVFSSEPLFTKTLTDLADERGEVRQQVAAVSVGVVTNSPKGEQAEATATEKPFLRIVDQPATDSVGEQPGPRRQNIHYRQNGWKSCGCGACEVCGLETRILDAKALYLLPRSLVDAFRDRQDRERDVQLMRQLLDGAEAVLRTHRERGGKPRYWAGELRIAIDEDWAGAYRRRDALRLAARPPETPQPRKPAPQAPCDGEPGSVCWSEVIAGANIPSHLRDCYLVPLAATLEAQCLTLQAPSRWIRGWLESPDGLPIWRAVLAAAPPGLTVLLAADAKDQPRPEQKHAQA